MAEIRSLTGLRGVAALTVFLAHTRETLTEQGVHLQVPTLVERLFLSGGRQVDIFFVLSGFILALTYQAWFSERLDRRSYFKFLQRRFARIYPLHFVMLIAVIALVVAAKLTQAQTRYSLDRFDFSTLPEHFLLLHALNLFGNGPGIWNPPSWSISIEALAYLLFPLLLYGCADWARRRPWVLVLLAIVCGFGLNAATHWGLDGFPAIARGLSEFALGCMVVNLSGSPVDTWLRSELGSTTAVAVLALAYALTPDTGFIIGAAAAPLLLSLCADNAVSKVLSTRVIFYVGEISYSIYLGHFLYCSVAYRVISIPWMRTGALPTVLGLLFIFGFVIALSSVTYFAVERPGRNFLSARRKSKTGVV